MAIGCRPRPGYRLEPWHKINSNKSSKKKLVHLLGDSIKWYQVRVNTKIKTIFLSKNNLTIIGSNECRLFSAQILFAHGIRSLPRFGPFSPFFMCILCHILDVYWCISYSFHMYIQHLYTCMSSSCLYISRFGRGFGNDSRRSGLIQLVMQKLKLWLEQLR